MPKKIAFGVIGILILGGLAFYFFHSAPKYKTPAESDPFVRFDMEAYDLISANYWIPPGGFSQFKAPELPNLFQLALQKVAGGDPALATSTRAATAVMLGDAFKNATSTDAKRSLAVTTLQVVLYNLTPAGRDELLSQQEETALRQNEANVNPANDLYGDLGLSKGASAAAINAAYATKSAALSATTSEAGKAELQKASYAHEVLSSAAGKALYDSAGVEPSVFPHILGHTLYLSFDKMSPTTLQEFATAVDNASTTPGLESMILDFRGNIGGDLSLAPAFLGLFIGNGQYAFDLYHQGAEEPQRTTEPVFPELSRYGDIAVLTDDMTQSTAELAASELKRYRLAHIVGTKTHGWGSVENTYPLTTSIDPSISYALLLVNSLTLGTDENPIEQNGVVPDVDTSSAGWQTALSGYFRSPSLISALKSEAGKPPLQ